MMVIDKLRENGKRIGKTHAELGWILEDNKATNNLVEDPSALRESLGVTAPAARPLT